MSDTAVNTLRYSVQAGGQLNGEIRVPGDKSISHRSIMLGSLAEGVTEVEGFLDGADCLATLSAFRQMGVDISEPKGGKLTVQGAGMHGLQAPAGTLDLGNSGTSMRLMAGLLAGQPFASCLAGDHSLNSRPMRRVTDPLASMGATIATTAEGTAPLHISGGDTLRGLRYCSPVASAQVKSAVLLAGLYAHGETEVVEPGISRDHTERMLQTLGYPVEQSQLRCSLLGGGKLKAGRIQVPADISSATFFMLGAAIAPGSDVLLKDVGINPTRTGVIDILNRMGADISVLEARAFGAEPVADIRVRGSQLQGIVIPSDLVPLAIDEFPAIFIAAACAKGETLLTDAAELRVKESDRIQVMADGLQSLGIDAQPQPDGMVIHGGELRGGRVNSHGDHRIAMSFAMAGLRAKGEIIIDDCQNVATSFPNFLALAANAGLKIDATHD